MFKAEKEEKKIIYHEEHKIEVQSKCFSSKDLIVKKKFLFKAYNTIEPNTPNHGINNHQGEWKNSDVKVKKEDNFVILSENEKKLLNFNSNLNDKKASLIIDSYKLNELKRIRTMTIQTNDDIQEKKGTCFFSFY